MSKETGTFKRGKPGYAYKDGKLYRFERRSVLVLSSWPDPRVWYKTDQWKWISSRQRADMTFCRSLFPKGLENVIAIDIDSDPRLRVWTGDPSQPSPEEIAHYERYGGFEDHSTEAIIRQREKIIQKRKRLEQVNGAMVYFRNLQAPYFNAIPDEVRSELLRYGERKWHLLSLFARCPGALDLSRGNPALCYALASNWVFHKPAVDQPMRAARSLIGKKQRHIMDWLGFPATESARRLLQKLDPRYLNVRGLLGFRRVLGDPELAKWLSHMKHIEKPVWELVSWRVLRPRLTRRFLFEIAEDARRFPDECDGFGMLKDTLGLVKIVPNARLPDQFTSLRQLKMVHDELAAQNRMQWQIRGPMMGEAECRFPKPPFAGTQSIQPIQSIADLYQEGEEMHHCVGAYWPRVYSGHYYVYKVTAPIRATLGISRCPDGGGWGLASLMQACNTRVDTKAAEAIFEDLVASGAHGSADGEESAALNQDVGPFEDNRDGQLTLFG